MNSMSHHTLVPYAPVGELDSLTQARVDSLWQLEHGDEFRDSINEGIVITNPTAGYKETVAENDGFGTSCIILVLLLLFSAVCLRIRSNRRYLSTIMTDLFETRVRPNTFDDTVRESSFLLLLNLLWSFSAGVLLYKALEWGIEAGIVGPFGDGLGSDSSIGMALCVGVMVTYLIVMTVSYYSVGVVFYDKARTKVWMKGYYASQGLASFVLFPISLLAVSYAPWTDELLILSGIVIILGKLIFIFKGFRIFFKQVTSLLLFLYYLCSLEIVPLVLVYSGAALLCSTAL